MYMYPLEERSSYSTPGSVVIVDCLGVVLSEGNCFGPLFADKSYKSINWTCLLSI